MKVNTAAVTRWFETTGPLTFLGMCFILIGLGILDQPITRQLAGFIGAFMVGVITWRPLADIYLARSEDHGSNT